MGNATCFYFIFIYEDLFLKDSMGHKEIRGGVGKECNCSLVPCSSQALVLLCQECCEDSLLTSNDERNWLA